jgi:prepilin-type processing-associated H-X9-DG protein
MKTRAVNGASDFPGAGRHTGGSNYLFTDGHFRYLSGDKVSSGAPAAKRTDAQDASGPGVAAGTGNKAFEATFSPI